MDSPNVLIAEDHAVVREGTRQILERGGVTVVGEAADGQEAVDMSVALQPDVVVLDIRLPVVSGIEAARQIAERCVGTKVLILSAYDDEEYVTAAMEAGASGYLLKTAHGDEVVSAIHAIVRGEVILQSSVAAALWKTRAADGVEAEGDLDGPTDRELEILAMAARGLRNKEIARQLQLSVRTVEGHLSHLFAKLGVASRTEAIILGAARGWYPLDGRD